ncbi:MAG: NifU family protein [Phycisphaerales bacterium]
MSSLPIHPGTGPSSATPIAANPNPHTVEGRVQRVLELIRPAVQSDGGDLELVGVTPDGVVQIRLHGACVGCPSSAATLQIGIEKNLKDHVPEVRSVQAVD